MKNKLNKVSILDYSIVLIACIIVLIPVIFMVGTSLKSINEILTAPTATLWPKEISFEGYRNIWHNYPFWTFLKNSLVTSIVSTLISVFISVFSGYGFSRFKFKGRTTMMFFILTTQMFPSVMLFVPFYKLLSMYGLSKSVVGLILIYISTAIPFCSWMMYGFFDSISRELDEAAYIDGCGHFRTFFQIVAPLVLPGIVTITIFSFIRSWNEYMFTMLIATKEELQTLTVAIGSMAGYLKVLWNDLMAASVISCIPLVILFVFLQKYFISSMSQGAVKE